MIIPPLPFPRENCYPLLTIYSGFLIAEPFERFVDGIHYLKTHSVGLVVLDIIMFPGINGREIYERIIKRHPNQKAIIASGFAETEGVKDTQELGAGKYIKKPFTLMTLAIAVKEELEK